MDTHLPSVINLQTSSLTAEQRAPQDSITGQQVANVALRVSAFALGAFLTLTAIAYGSVAFAAPILFVPTILCATLAIASLSAAFAPRRSSGNPSVQVVTTRPRWYHYITPWSWGRVVRHHFPHRVVTTRRVVGSIPNSRPTLIRNPFRHRPALHPRRAVRIPTGAPGARRPAGTRPVVGGPLRPVPTGAPATRRPAGSRPVRPVPGAPGGRPIAGGRPVPGTPGTRRVAGMGR